MASEASLNRVMMPSNDARLMASVMPSIALAIESALDVGLAIKLLNESDEDNQLARAARIVTACSIVFQALAHSYYRCSNVLRGYGPCWAPKFLQTSRIPRT